MLISVNFSLEADSIEEAAQIVSTWHVTAGTTLYSISGMTNGMETPVQLTRDGEIGNALLVSGQRSTPFVPMDPADSFIGTQIPPPPDYEVPYDLSDAG